MLIDGWFRWLIAAVFAALLQLLGGCALLNESSMARRADTYDPGTEVRINPRTGELWAKSTGDDKVILKDAQFGDKKVGELTVDLQRSPVVHAQGDRAQAATELMGQQIALNEQWRMAWAQTLQELRGLIGDLAPMISSYRLQSQQIAATQPSDHRIDRLERLMEALLSQSKSAGTQE